MRLTTRLGRGAVDFVAKIIAIAIVIGGIPVLLLTGFTPNWAALLALAVGCAMLVRAWLRGG